MKKINTITYLPFKIPVKQAKLMGPPMLFLLTGIVIEFIHDKAFLSRQSK